MTQTGKTSAGNSDFSDTYKLLFSSIIDSKRTEDENYAEKIRAFNDLVASSEQHYIAIAESIVKNSISQLEKQQNNKKTLRERLQKFFIWALSVQLFVMFVLMFFDAFFCWFDISETVLIAYMGTVFVETLGAALAMVKFAFDSEQEVKVLGILNTVISSFQKFKG